MKTRGAMASLLVVLILAVLLAGTGPGAVAVSVTVPYSATGVADADLDGNPATGDWSGAASTAVPLENGAATPYESATLYAKHDNAYAYFRIDGKIDVPWTSTTDNHFWLGVEFSPSGTNHHGGSGAWDGVFFGESSYTPAPTYPPSAVDTNGFGKPPAKDTAQHDLGHMAYSGTAAPYSFTAEWKQPMKSGDSQDIVLTADGTTAYNFFVTTDSDGGGSSGGVIDHSKITNLNTMRFETPPSPVTHDVAATAASASPTSVLVGQTVTISATVQNLGTGAETFDVKAYAGTQVFGPQTVTNLAAGASKTLTFPWDTTGVAAGSYAIKAEAILATDTNLGNNVYTDGTVAVSAVAHDVAITAAAANPLSAVVGTAVAVTATAANQGTQAETFDVSAYAGAILVGTQTVTSLAAGGSKSLTFSWDTSAVAAGAYVIQVQAAPLSGETDTADNVFTDGTVTLAEPVHDVAVTAMVAAPTTANVGDTIAVSVSVANQGNQPETFTVTALANGVAIGATSVSLAAGATKDVPFSWSTAGLAAGTYTLSAQASAVLGETDTADNTFADGAVVLNVPAPATPVLKLGRVWADWRRGTTGTTLVLYAKVTNVGTVDAYAKVIYDIYDKATGALVASVSSGVVLVPAGTVVSEIAFASGPWTSTAGIYTVVATLVYGTDAGNLNLTDGMKSISRIAVL